MSTPFAPLRKPLTVAVASLILAGCSSLNPNPLQEQAIRDRAASDAFVDRVQTHEAEHGFGFWVVERQADAPDIDGRGYVRGQLPVGRFAKAKVIGHTDYDLIAAPV